MDGPPAVGAATAGAGAAAAEAPRAGRGAAPRPAAGGAGILLYYKYVPLAGAEARVAAWYEELCGGLMQKGRVRVAVDGVNVVVSAPAERSAPQRRCEWRPRRRGGPGRVRTFSAASPRQQARWAAGHSIPLDGQSGERCPRSPHPPNNSVPPKLPLRLLSNHAPAGRRRGRGPAGAHRRRQGAPRAAGR